MLSDLVRRPLGAVGQMVILRGEGRMLTSIIAAAELRYGASKAFTSELANAVKSVLERIEVAPLESPADEVYGRIRADLERQGQIIGLNDMLIAAHALALDCTLVTDNIREFSRVPDLRLENWLR